MRKLFDRWKKSNKLILAVEGILVIVIIVSAVKITDYLLDNMQSADYADNLQKAAVITEQENVSEDDAIQIPKAIDFDYLHSINQDVVAWICDDTLSINYAVAQTDNNAYYLNHQLDGSDSVCGTIFMDYRNQEDFSNWNTILYGHNMKNGSMFAQILRYREPAYYKEHPVMYLYVPGKRYVVQLLAGYTVGADDKIFQLPQEVTAQQEILDYAYQHSTFTSGIQAEQEDRLVTLSTCAYSAEDARYILIGRITEEEVHVE